ncbi:DUF2214 domain-containing protein [Aquabacter spiritensis]|uniref:Uncharacterized protein n=1 Tax=Aquabacter spiritensis TaxID=933073 RepID=A0A4R3LWL3_9HYPH|nr:DUF2214 domain-containing protein [Aquabacter spiritensis]TCT05021.1 hypothetical protein EDC64_10552 [Aquabacter spiritensis]
MAGLEALSDWPGAVLLREEVALYAAVNAAHIFALALLVGAIATLDLRLLGLFPAASPAVLAPPLVRVAAAGLLLAVLTGFALFSVRPVAYAQNPAFLAKLALVGLGIANALLLRLGPDWRRLMARGAVSLRLKAAALVSLLLWAGAVFAGRWIGFLG